MKATIKQALGYYDGGGLDLENELPAWSMSGFLSKKIGKATEDFSVSILENISNRYTEEELKVLIKNEEFEDISDFISFVNP